MSRFFCVIIILFANFFGSCLYCNNIGGQINILSNISEQDTIKDKQILYNGSLWTNMYHRIEGDQFLFSALFLTGTISINGKIFKNVRIKYDIYSDEIITPLNIEEILQLNKEMVDSFTISFEDKVYRFENIRNDTLKDFSGYANLLYSGKSSFYVKYKKSISPAITVKSDGDFNQDHMIYFVKDKMVYPISGTKTLFKVLNADKDQLRNFIRKNRLKISKKIPESFVPVIRFCDKISQ